MSVVEKGPSTKEKLSSIVHGFDEFDLEMKKGTRVRYLLLLFFVTVILINFQLTAKKRKG